MPQDTWPNGADAELAGLARRRDALRQSANMPGADPRSLLDAAFAELDVAVEVLTRLPREEAGTAGTSAAVLGAERNMLRAVFQHAPVPMFLLGPDGTIRRANCEAGDIIGAPPGYATGKPLTAFVDPASRAAVHSQLAAVARTGTARQARCVLLGPDGPADVTLAARAVAAGDGARLLAVTAQAGQAGQARQARQGRQGGTDGGGAGHRAAPGTSASQDIAAMTRRMDLVTALTRLLLDNSTFSEAVTLQRCARLLAGDIAAWVIIDMDRSGTLRRQSVTGPHGERPEELARTVRAVDPPPESLPAQVHAAGHSVVLAHADDSGLLGTGQDGTPLTMLLGAASMLSVPICDEEAGYGVLTLARQAAEGPFSIADLALAEQLGQHLGVAIRVDRMFRHRSAVAEALQGSLLPARLPHVPGLDLSAAYVPASAGLEVGGDFYDVFPVAGGWAVAVGDVCGKGQEAAAMTAAARHAIRVIAHWNPDPVAVLAKVNEVIMAGDDEDRFVTAKLAYLRREGGQVRVELASAGHPGPALVRPDGRVTVLDGGGLPLGLFPDAAPERDTFELGQDDLLFFYSDGVTDARSPGLQYFEDRLADELAAVAGRPAADTARMIQQMIADFTEDNLRDDMTILVARVASPAGDG
jgi:serine phosphatase RsbU (regulator of sigma subunit)/PAS domain-containing protein